MKFDVNEAFLKNVKSGYGTYASAKFRIYDPHTKVTIGKFTCIAADTQIIVGGHHNKHFVTQYPFNDNELKISFKDIPTSEIPYDCSCGDIEIGSDVWIGSNCLILSGAKIGNGSVIGAGSVIRRQIIDRVNECFRYEVPAYSIVVGNPAEIVSYRFDADTIRLLEKIAWWDWPLDKIQEAMPLLHSEGIEVFISRYSKGENK